MQDASTETHRSLAAQGLVPGIVLRLHVARGGHEETLSTVVEHVTRERIEVLAPMHRRTLRPLPVGTHVGVEYSHQRKEWKFASQVTGRTADAAYEYLALPESIESTERRGRFRLATSLPPSEAFLIRGNIDGDGLTLQPLTRALITDLSEGGLCLSCQGRVLVGERVRIRAQLGGAGEIAAEALVLGVEEPRAGYVVRRLHCRFVDISRADSDRIARYLVRRQLELRKGGRL